MADNDEEKQPAYDEDEKENGFFRWMSAAVVLLAVAGFFGLAWYAYKNGGETVDEKDVELVKADKIPVKEAPVNPGGMQIPNQDKTVYGLINGGKTDKPNVERILPAPEEPIVRGGDIETWMSDKAKNKTDGESATAPATPAPSVAISETPAAPTADNTQDNTKKAEQFNPAKIRLAEETQKAPETQLADNTTAPAATQAPVTPPVTPQVSVSEKPAEKAPEQAPASAAPVPAAVTPATEAASAPAAPAPVPAPVAALPATPKATKILPQKATVLSDDAVTPPSGPRVQLGAYKTEAEAKNDWKKISKKFSDDIGDKQHYFVHVDLGAKGVFYRLQLAPFDSAKEAEEFCLNFVSERQGCFLAKSK